MTSRFLTHFLAFALACYAVLFGLRSVFGTAVVHPLAPWLLAALLLLVLLGYGLTARAVRRNPDNFLGAYFGGVAVRLVLGVGIIIWYFYHGGKADTAALLSFLGAFFVAYFLCVGFEIWAIFSNLRPFSAGQDSKNE